jgi:uroporphyrinogen decarboxylase
MVARERFIEISNFERKNDPSFFGIFAWTEALKRWVKEGMPVKNLENMKEINMHLLGYQDQVFEAIIPNAAVMGMGPLMNPPWVPPLDPLFQVKIVKDEGETVVQVDYDGSVVRRKKNDTESMPQWLEYPVKDKKSWEEYKRRLDPFSSGRWPEGWDIMTDDKLNWPIKKGQEGKSFEERDFALGMLCLSLYGMPRNYMGLENFSIATKENLKLVEEMIEWQTYLSYEMIKKVFASGITIDWVWVWEDMAFNKGSLISPSFVKKYMAPRYKKITSLLQQHGVTAIILDSDGNTEELIPIWLDCGINAHYPFERASNMDAIKLRKKYGKNLIIVGNVDKRNLAKGKNEIDFEVERIKTLIKEGGFFPGCDHHIPPDVSYENIVYFLNEVHKLSDYEETRRIIGN